MLKEFKNTKYIISDCGDVISPFTKKLLKGWKNSYGYLCVSINKKIYTVHSLVAETFLNKPDKYDIVINHIDGNKLNNDISNLEYISRAEYVAHAHTIKLIKNNKKIYCFELDMYFNSVTEAANFVGVSRSAISACLNKKQRTAGYSKELKQQLTWIFVR